MKTGFIYDNGGNKREVILNLKKGDILIAVGTKECKGDIGSSGMVFSYSAFVIGKVYKVNHTTNWDGVIIGYVNDEDSTCHFATTQLFKTI